MTRLRWRKHEASEPKLPQFVARVRVDRGAVSLYVHRDEDSGAGWSCDVEIEATTDPLREFQSKHDARKAALEIALTWARRLVVALERIEL